LKEGENWSGLRGRINKDMLDQFIPPVNQSTFYMSCGTAEFDRSAKKLFIEDFGVHEENYFRF